MSQDAPIGAGKPMTAISLMAGLLDAELQARGIFGVGRQDCEAIITAVIEAAAGVGADIEVREPAPLSGESS